MLSNNEALDLTVIINWKVQTFIICATDKALPYLKLEFDSKIVLCIPIYTVNIDSQVG